MVSALGDRSERRLAPSDPCVVLCGPSLFSKFGQPCSGGITKRYITCAVDTASITEAVSRTRQSHPGMSCCLIKRHATKAKRGSGGILPLILLGIRYVYVPTGLTPPPRNKPHLSTRYETAWAPENLCSYRESSLDSWSSSSYPSHYTD
jgi:hypothetical protein